jgi:hypothetical protein
LKPVETPRLKSAAANAAKRPQQLLFLYPLGDPTFSRSDNPNSSAKGGRIRVALVRQQNFTFPVDLPKSPNYDRLITALLKSLEELFKELPPQSRAQVIDFAEFLVKRRKRKPACNLRQTWAGALSEYRDQYTSLELQKMALAWRRISRVTNVPNSPDTV